MDVTNDMEQTWNVDKKELRNTAVSNIRKYAEYTVYSLLFGRAAKHTIIPFFKVSLDICAANIAPFGASLLLVDEVDEKVSRRLENFADSPWTIRHSMHCRLMFFSSTMWRRMKLSTTLCIMDRKTGRSFTEQNCSKPTSTSQKFRKLKIEYHGAKQNTMTELKK